MLSEPFISSRQTITRAQEQLAVLYTFLGVIFTFWGVLYSLAAANDASSCWSRKALCGDKRPSGVKYLEGLNSACEAVHQVPSSMTQTHMLGCLKFCT